MINDEAQAPVNYRIVMAASLHVKNWHWVVKVKLGCVMAHLLVRSCQNINFSSFVGNITVIYSINITEGHKGTPGMNLACPTLVLSATGRRLIGSLVE